jgi:hypothetical protein
VFWATPHERKQRGMMRNVFPRNSFCIPRHFDRRILEELLSSTITGQLPLLTRFETGVQSADSSCLHPSFDQPMDDELLCRVCQGDQEALASLFRRYGRIVHGVANRVLKDTSEADDLLQDIFLLVHRLCGSFDSSSLGAQRGSGFCR